MAADLSLLRVWGTTELNLLKLLQDPLAFKDTQSVAASVKRSLIDEQADLSPLLQVIDSAM